MSSESIGCEGKNIQILYDILHYSRDTARVQIKIIINFSTCMCKTNPVKKYGLRLILVDFIMGMKELENPGIFINNFGWVRGKLLLTTNDNPVAGLLLRTKESAGLSKRICHTCLITNEDAKKQYKLNPEERSSRTFKEMSINRTG